MSPDSTEVAVVETTGVVTEVVTAEEGEVISHTVLAEGVFVPTIQLGLQGSSYTL
jgi:hypothetical protein